MTMVVIEAALRSLALAAAVWLALRFLRVSNPHVGQSAWRWVLMAALAMPLLMQWRTLALPSPAPELLSIVRLDSAPPESDRQFDWQSVAMTLYFIVAVTLALRQLIGYARMYRIRRNSESVREAWADGMDVRASTSLHAPVAFGSTILLPADRASWSSVMRESVLAHERTHVENRDFLFQALAHVHRVIFWFSPLAWWLPHRLGLLSEQLSDDAAIRAVRDRAGYAEILLSFARVSHDVAFDRAAIQMARAKTLAHRIERIVSANELPASLSVARRMGLASALVPLALVVAGCSARTQGNAPTIAELTSPTAPANFDHEPVLPENAALPRSNPEIPLSHATYPSVSRKAGQEGTVILQVYVAADGSAENVKIAKSSGFPRLDYSAANEALNWKMNPGTIDGQPRAMWGSFAVTFKLAADEKPSAPLNL